MHACTLTYKSVLHVHICVVTYHGMFCSLDLGSRTMWLRVATVKLCTWLKLGPIECGSSHDTNVSQTEYKQIVAIQCISYISVLVPDHFVCSLPDCRVLEAPWCRCLVQCLPLHCLVLPLQPTVPRNRHETAPSALMPHIPIPRRKMT